MNRLEPCVESLRRIVDEHTAYAFVWHGETLMPNNLDEIETNRRIEAGEVQPLIVDPTTANLLVKVVEALRPDVQEKVSGMIASDRGSFGAVVNRAWKCVS